MPTIDVREMDSSSEYFVGTCSHVNESLEIDSTCRKRIEYFHRMYDTGLRVKVGYLDGMRAGFLYMMPIESSPWGPIGRDLMTIPCLFVVRSAEGKGIGQALLARAEDEARNSGRKAIVTTGYYHDFWFMPAAYFERQGYLPVAKQGKGALLWKVFDNSARAPLLMSSRYRFESSPGKVVVDLFWNQFCQTSAVEAQRVREVASEFGDSVEIREYAADDHEVLMRHQTPRAIYVNGCAIGWGYEAPEEGIREAISKALARINRVIPALEYEPAKPQDYDGFLRLMYAEAQDYLERTMAFMQMSSQQFSQLFRNTGEVFAIKYEGEKAGFYWIEERGRVLHVHGLILRREIQGKGIGSKILKMLEEGYLGKVSTIEIGSHKSNHRAIALYEKLGYCTVKKLDHLDFIIMQKDIQAT